MSYLEECNCCMPFGKKDMGVAMGWGCVVSNHKLSPLFAITLVPVSNSMSNSSHMKCLPIVLQAGKATYKYILYLLESIYFE